MSSQVEVPIQESNPDPEDLRTEYIQAGEEARYRHRLMQNSYYLCLILNGAFVGALFGQFNQGNWLLAMAGSGIATLSIAFLAVTLHSNISKRSAAWARRASVEMLETDHDTFRIQRDTLHRRAEVVHEDGEQGYIRHPKNIIERMEAKWIPYIFAVNALGWSAFGIWALYELLI